MAKPLDKFTKPFRDSRIPFLLLEVLTNGRGAMVDLVCRFANGAAALLLDLTAEELRDQRLTRNFPGEPLTSLLPLADVAFSGSSVSFSITTPLGRTLDVTAYQPMYGMAACVLEPRGAAPAAVLPTESLPCPAAVVELSRAGARCLSLNQALCALTGRTRRSLLDAAARDLSALVVPEDWPPLLQDLLDAARDRRSVDRELRLRCGKDIRWVDLRSAFLGSQEGVSTFYILFLDMDRRRRDAARLEAQIRDLELAQAQTERLLDQLPGGRCIVRLEDGVSPVPLLVTEGFARLLGYPLAELKRRLTLDPLWRVPAAERGSLVAAARRSRETGTPLRHTFRVRPKGSRAIQVSLEAVWQPLETGGWLLCAVCTDVTTAHLTTAELEVRARLCELLLDRSRLLSFDYDRTRDTARIHYHAADGRRFSQTEEGYAASLADSGAIHPDDRQTLADALRRGAPSDTETLEYQADYDGCGWRWYRLSLTVSPDNVNRLLGKAEDITRQKAAARRFQDLVEQQKTLASPMLACARLDLSADRILDAKGADEYLTRVLFGNTADACLRHLRDNVPDGAQRTRFDTLFRRDALLESFVRGETHLELEHRFSTGDGGPRHVRTRLELTEDPESLHANAFCTVEDLGAIPSEQTLADAVSALEAAPEWVSPDGHRWSWLDKEARTLRVTLKQ